ncbi:Peptidase A1 [Macrophomina phaseolina MS6]|uniref:Peptidase A1 n=1 Tax=Macrophomina phaseolina (strain MS6) TaxID=1126212 RepID=K2R4I8_MACPH|nr:Peptidase A1 [Macrophomina phaseolina MS6]
MIAQEDISKDAELFTAYLGSTKDTNEADKGESFYTFGYVDQDVLKAAEVSEPHYVDIDNSQGFWQFESASASVNGKTIARSGNTAIADTGTTLALLDDQTVEAIYAAIPGSKYDSTNQGYVFPSSTTADQLPTVTFAVGGKQFAVQKEDLAFADAGDGFLYGGIQSRGDMAFDILGDTFLKGIYAVSEFSSTLERARRLGEEGTIRLSHNRLKIVIKVLTFVPAARRSSTKVTSASAPCSARRRNRMPQPGLAHCKNLKSVRQPQCFHPPDRPRRRHPSGGWQAKACRVGDYVTRSSVGWLGGRNLS